MRSLRANPTTFGALVVRRTIMVGGKKPRGAEKDWLEGRTRLKARIDRGPLGKAAENVKGTMTQKVMYTVPENCQKNALAGAGVFLYSIHYVMVPYKKGLGPNERENETFG